MDAGLGAKSHSWCWTSSYYKPVEVLFWFKTLAGKYIVIQTSTAHPHCNFSNKTHNNSHERYHYHWFVLRRPKGNNQKQHPVFRNTLNSSAIGWDMCWTGWIIQKSEGSVKRNKRALHMRLKGALPRGDHLGSIYSRAGLSAWSNQPCLKLSRVWRHRIHTLKDRQIRKPFIHPTGVHQNPGLLKKHKTGTCHTCI